MDLEMDDDQAFADDVGRPESGVMELKTDFLHSDILSILFILSFLPLNSR